MRLAVILPIYNAEKTLVECLDSLFIQSFSDFCVLAVNDASTDGSPAILENYAKQEHRLRVYHFDNNQGEPKATQFAMELSNCMKIDYVARMDADDICLPNRFEKQIAYLDAHPEIGVLGSNMLCFNMAGGVHLADIKYTDSEIKANIGAVNPSICNPTVMYRQAHIKPLNIQYNQGATACDYGMWVDCAIKGVEFANLPDILLKYRLHDGQASRKSQLMNQAVQVFLERFLSVLFPILTKAEIAAFAAINHGLGDVTLTRDSVNLAFAVYDKIKHDTQSVLGEDRALLLSHYANRVNFVKSFL